LLCVLQSLKVGPEGLIDFPLLGHVLFSDPAGLLFPCFPFLLGPRRTRFVFCHARQCFKPSDVPIFRNEQFRLMYQFLEAQIATNKLTGECSQGRSEEAHEA
jgi:hypothetical protein